MEANRNSSVEQIKAAYKKKMSLYHPDKVAALGKEFLIIAETKAKEINRAYQEAVKLRC